MAIGSNVFRGAGEFGPRVLNFERTPRCQNGRILENHKIVIFYHHHEKRTVP